MPRMPFKQLLVGLAVIALAQPADAQLQQKWDNTVGATLYDVYNKAVWLYQNGLTPGNVQTLNNILDDGTGAANIKGALVTQAAITGPTITGLNSAISGVTTTANNAASAITTLQSRATTDEGLITALQTRATTDETSITNNANAIAALQTRATTDETAITSANTAITALQNRATTDEATIAQTTINVSNINATVIAQGTSISGLQSSVSTLQNAPVVNPLLINATGSNNFVVQNPGTSTTLLKITPAGVATTKLNTLDNGAGAASFVGITTDSIQSGNSQQDSLTVSAKTSQFSGDVTVTGNLYVNGVKQTLVSSNTVVEAGLIELATNNTLADMIPIGMSGNYYTNSAIHFGGVTRLPSSSADANAGSWIVYDSTQDPGANGYTAGNPWVYTTAPLVAKSLAATGAISTTGAASAATLTTTGVATVGGLLTATGGLTTTGAVAAGTVTTTGLTKAATFSNTAGTFTTDASGNVGAAAVTATSATTTGQTKAGTFTNTAGTFNTDSSGNVNGVAITASGAVTGASFKNTGNSASIASTGAIVGTSLNVGSGSVTAQTATFSGLVSVGPISGPSMLWSASATGVGAFASLSTTGGITAGTTLTGNALVVNTAYGIASTGAATVSSVAAGSGAVTTTGPVNAGTVTVTNQLSGNNATFSGPVTAQSFVSTSDMRLKSNIHELDSMTSVLKKLRPVQYHFTSDRSERRQFGLLAQELKEVFPDTVHVREDGMLAVDYTALIAPMLKSIQELTAQVEDLQAQQRSSWF